MESLNNAYICMQLHSPSPILHVPRRTYTHSNRPNENKTDAPEEMGGCVINCCLSPPTDNDGLYPGECAGNRFYLEGLFIVFLIGGAVCLEWRGFK